jgi:hypothetical protein
MNRFAYNSDILQRETPLPEFRLPIGGDSVDQVNLHLSVLHSGVTLIQFSLAQKKRPKNVSNQIWNDSLQKQRLVACIPDTEGVGHPTGQTERY